MIGSHSKGHSQSGAGFTLIEVIITMAVFSIASLMAVNLFIIFVQQQRRTLNQQELQNDARAVMEGIAKDVREGSIDYTYYASVFPLPGGQQKLFTPLLGSGNDCLVLRDAVNSQILYRLNGAVVERLVPASPSNDACSTRSGWEPISPNTLTVSRFVFTISPTEDPFAAQAAQICTADVDCRWGTVCLSGGTCINKPGSTCYCFPQKYGDYNEIAPLHPKVTFSFNVSRSSNNQVVSQTFQTAISSRVFKNFDRLNSYVP